MYIFELHGRACPSIKALNLKNCGPCNGLVKISAIMYATQKYDIYTTYVCLTETYKNQTCNKQPYLRCTTVGPSLCKNMIE